MLEDTMDAAAVARVFILPNRAADLAEMQAVEATAGGDGIDIFSGTPDATPTNKKLNNHAMPRPVDFPSRPSSPRAPSPMDVREDSRGALCSGAAENAQAAGGAGGAAGSSYVKDAPASASASAARTTPAGPLHPGDASAKETAQKGTAAPVSMPAPKTLRRKKQSPPAPPFQLPPFASQPLQVGKPKKRKQTPQDASTASSNPQPDNSPVNATITGPEKSSLPCRVLCRPF